MGVASGHTQNIGFDIYHDKPHRFASPTTPATDRREPQRVGEIRLGLVMSATEDETPLPRGMVVAEAWKQLGDGVKALSNTSGRPLARTVKLILDPLVLRPTGHRRFSQTLMTRREAEALCDAILNARELLSATAEWFTILKQVRRQRRIADGNPQDLYFQRCYELAHLHGPPETATAQTLADDVIDDVHNARADKTVENLRDHVNDPVQRPRLEQLLADVWLRPRTSVSSSFTPETLERLLSECSDTTHYRTLVDGAAGSAQSIHLDDDGNARAYGLTVHDLIQPPVLGERASKSRLPRPFDRSILERMFASFTTVFHRETMADIPTLVVEEIHRSHAPWQLSNEHSRVMMALGWAAVRNLSGDSATPVGRAHIRLRSRWQREAYVRRVLRLPTPTASGVPDDLHEDILHVQRPYMRRLWVRLHGRELRNEGLEPEAVWDLLDGVLRSVIMDQRSRLRENLAHRGVST